MDSITILEETMRAQQRAADAVEVQAILHNLMLPLAFPSIVVPPGVSADGTPQEGTTFDEEARADLIRRQLTHVEEWLLRTLNTTKETP